MIQVLVVDDDFMVARIHCMFVERTEGFAVAGVAHTGVEAVDLAKKIDPDLILLDVHLPDISGLEVLQRLRDDGRQVAVVMVTADRGAAAVRGALHGGAMHYLVKPFEYDDFADRLRRVAQASISLPTAEAGTSVDQATIDKAFGGGGSVGVVSRELPKGMSPQTADLLLEAVRSNGEISASQAAESCGVSRVTARRYLEHFVEIGAAEVRLQYGAAGRPQRRYRIK